MQIGASILALILFQSCLVTSQKTLKALQCKLFEVISKLYQNCIKRFVRHFVLFKVLTISHWEQKRTICPEFFFQSIVFIKMESIDWLEMDLGQIVLPCSQRDIDCMDELGVSMFLSFNNFQQY